MTITRIEQSLLEQLRAAGADIDAFRGLVSDYTAMYRVCEQLKKDIRKNGAMVKATGSAGQEIIKPNPAIKELRDTSKSMIAILKQLGLSIDTVRQTDDDEL